MPKLSTQELKGILETAKQSALGSDLASELSTQRESALKYYQGDMTADLPALQGRSQAVSTDVSDTIEGLMSSLMEIFAGSEDVVRFDPIGKEDVAAAQQETEVVNFVFRQKCNGFMVLYHLIKDALLSKNGIVKVWWQEQESEDEDTYYDQSDDVFALVSMDPNVEIVAHTEKDGPHSLDPQTGQMIPTKLHDFTIRSTTDESHLCVEPVPPEEFGISRRAKFNLQDSPYLFHETLKSQSELIDEGYDEQQIMGLPSYSDPADSKSAEQVARDTVLDTNQFRGDESLNKAMRPIRVTEHYIKLDYDGEGVAKRYKITTAGEAGEILEMDGEPDIEEIDFWPFASATPVPQTHRFFGRSIADLVMDIQRIKTVLVRGYLDNIYFAINPRPVVAESAATPDTMNDLMTWQQGFPIRVKAIEGLTWMQVPDVSSTILPAMSYFDTTREWRTGVTRQGMGLDANALQNQSATAALQQYDAATARMKLIARIIAETGVKDLMWLVHSTLRKYGNKALTVQLRNQWVTVDPREWKERDDMTVNVALGTGGPAQQASNAQGIIALQGQAMAGGLPIVKPQQMYNAATEYLRAIKIKDVDRYFTDPGEGDMPQKPDPEQMRAQVDQQKAVMDSQLKQQEIQLKAEIEKVQAEADIATQNRKIEAELALKQQEFELKRQLALIEHQIKVEESQMKAAQMQAADNTPKASIQIKHEAKDVAEPLALVVQQLGEHMANMQRAHSQAQDEHRQVLAEALKKLNAPRHVVRDKHGKVQGVVTD